MPRGRKPLAQRGIDELQETLSRRTAKGRGTNRVERLLNQKRVQGLSEGQREGLFGRAAAQSEAGARSSIANLSARLGGDTQNPLFAFLSQTTQASASAQTAASLADIEIEESRRMQEVGLQSERTRLGFRQLGFEKEQFESQFDAERQSQRGRAQRSFNRATEPTAIQRLADAQSGKGSKFGFFRQPIGQGIGTKGFRQSVFGRLDEQGRGIDQFGS